MFHTISKKRKISIFPYSVSFNFISAILETYQRRQELYQSHRYSEDGVLTSRRLISGDLWFTRSSIAPGENLTRAHGNDSTGVCAQFAEREQVRQVR